MTEGSRDTVTGIDGTASGWLAAEVGTSGSIRFRAHHSLAALVDRLAPSMIIGVDIPLGLPPEGYRRADQQARDMLGPRRGSVYLVPPEAILRVDDYAQARRLWVAHRWHGTSRQAFALRAKIFEAADVAAVDGRLREVHPELSFHLMNHGPLRASKHSWDGVMERLELLRSHGLVVPMSALGLPHAAPDDVVDAVAAAWSAGRIARGEAVTFPADPTAHEPAIWA